MKTLSLNQLKSLKVCSEQLEIFETTFGDEMELTKDNWEIILDKMSQITWRFIGYLFTRSQKEKYEKTIQPEWEKYKKAIQPNYEKYEKAILVEEEKYTETKQLKRKRCKNSDQPDWKKFHKEIRLDREKYKKAKRVEYEKYRKTIQPEWEKYKKFEDWLIFSILTEKD